jgi:hypothetical protein
MGGYSKMDLKKFDQYIEGQKNVSEGKEVPEAFIEKLRDLTDSNYHMEARLEVAKFLKNKKLIKVYQAMTDIQNALGFMPSGLSDARYQIDKDFLYPSCAQKLGRQGASQIHGSL